MYFEDKVEEATQKVEQKEKRQDIAEKRKLGNPCMTKMSSRKKKKEYEAEETIKEIILSTMNGKR